MGRTLRSLTALQAVLLVSVVVIAQQRPEAPGEAPADPNERWESMTEVERDRYRARYEELEKLDSGEREELRKRAQRLDQLARTTYRSLDEQTRAELDQLLPEKRRELLREMAVAEARELGRRILAKLPTEDRERLEQATSDDRMRFFLEFEQRQARRLDEAIEKQGSEFLSTKELQRLKGLGDQQRREGFLRIVKRRMIRWESEYGLPEGIGQRRWEVMRELPPPEFWMALERVRRKHGGFERPGERPARDGVSALLMRAMDVGLEPERRLEFSHLERHERRQRIRGLQRERVREVVREQGLMQGEELARFEVCADDQFFQKVRSLVSGSRVRMGPPGGGGAPRRREGGSGDPPQPAVPPDRQRGRLWGAGAGGG